MSESTDNESPNESPNETTKKQKKIKELKNEIKELRVQLKRWQIGTVAAIGVVAFMAFWGPSGHRDFQEILNAIVDATDKISDRISKGTKPDPSSSISPPKM
jgi:hypothetical protein